MYLASASNDIKILKLPELEIIRSFAPHNLYTNSLTWSCDNSLLASSGAELDTQVHSDVANVGQSVCLAPNTKHSVIRFTNKSPNIMGTSSDNGITIIWDVSKKVPIQAFKDLPNKPISMAFSPDDTVLSVGCETGHLGKGICMYELKKVANIHAMTPIEFANIEGASKIEYSYYEKDVMACGTNIGNIHIIDALKAKVVHKFESPVESPCADISFSTINDLLLVSLNKNGQLGFYDINSKNSIKSVETGLKTNCMKMLDDGTTLLVGTGGGRLEVFDLRAKFVSMNSIKAHTVGLRSICIQKKVGGGIKKEENKSTLSRKNSIQESYGHARRRESKDSASLKNDPYDAMCINIEKSPGVDTLSKLKKGATAKKNSDSTVGSEEIEIPRNQKDETASLRSVDKGESKGINSQDMVELRGSFEKTVQHLLRDFKEDIHGDIMHIYCSIINQFYDMKTHLKTNLELNERIEKLEKENKELNAAITSLKKEQDSRNIKF